MVIFVVIFAIFFCGIKKTGNSYFFRNLHLLSFPTIYSLPCVALKWRAYEFFRGGHGRTPVKVRSNLKTLSEVLPAKNNAEVLSAS